MIQDEYGYIGRRGQVQWKPGMFRWQVELICRENGLTLVTRRVSDPTVVATA